MAGIGFSLVSMVFSAVGNVFTKRSGQSLAKEMISAYIGVAIASAGVVWYFLGPFMFSNEPDSIQMLFPSDPLIWLQIFGVSLLGSMQQYFNICKSLDKFILNKRVYLNVVPFQLLSRLRRLPLLQWSEPRISRLCFCFKQYLLLGRSHYNGWELAWCLER